MICEKCGAKNVKDAKFCKACGENLEASSAKIDSQISRQIDPGTLIISERFKVLKKLGKGGMGEIFLAEDVKLKRKIAVKSILKTALADPTAKDRFLREAQTASQLDHPNICTMYEIYQEDERDYIVMQYIDGLTLNHIIQVERLSIRKILDIATQVCDGMIEANSKKIIHRDIKPANIMIDKKGTVTILDFGLAKFRDKSVVKENGMVDSNLTERGIVLGTVSYISPEQARGQNLDQRSDLFSFGIVLYEMLEGKNPFLDEEQIGTLYNVINKEVEFSRRDIPEELQRIVLKTLEKNQKKRYDNFTRLKEDLEAFKVRCAQLKAGSGDTFTTERIDQKELQVMQEEIEKSTDKENLGDIVYKIKKFKAYTDTVPSTKKNKLKYMLFPVILILAALAAYFLLTNGDDTPWIINEDFYIYIHKFENKKGVTPAVAEKINYLLKQSLNQFDRFKAIDIEAVPTGLRAKDIEENLALLKEKFNIEFELEGTLTRDKNFYNIDAKLVYYDEKKKKKIKKPITGTGEYLSSFLTIQVDTISSGVYNRFSHAKGEGLQVKKVSKIYGAQWRKFSNFFTGNNYLKRLELSAAEKYLQKAADLPAAKYLLARLYNFRGDRIKAHRLILELMTRAEEFTDPLKWRIQALASRLSFNFPEEIKNLEQLKDSFPFSKEVFYDMGEAYFQHRLPLEAIPFYEAALDLDPQYTMAINHLAYCHSFSGNHARASELFNEYKELDNTANSYDSLGDGYFYSGDLINAENFKKRAVQDDEQSVPYSYTGLADIYILKAEYKKARAALDDYYRVKKDNQAQARVTAVRAFILYLEGKYAEALKNVKKSLEVFDSDDINTDTGEAHWLKGLILLELNKVEECKNELEWLNRFKEKYNLSTDNFFKPYKYFLHLTALLYEKEGNIDRAGKTFAALLDMKHKLSFYTYFHYQFFHTRYAEFLSRNGKQAEALEQIEKCLEFNQNYIPALWVKAGILEKKKDRSGSAAVYSKIKELYGQSNEKNRLRKLLSRKGGGAPSP